MAGHAQFGRREAGAFARPGYLVANIALQFLGRVLPMAEGDRL